MSVARRWCPLLALPVALLVAADAYAAPGGLTKPEKKAVDIRGAEGASAGTATLLEIRFKGDLAARLGVGGLKRARLAVELVPESGPTTVITDRRSSDKPKESRSGSKGRFDVVRDGRRTLLLVEALPAPTDRVVITTSGPDGPASRGLRGDHGQFDQFGPPLPKLDTETQLKNELFRTEQTVKSNDARLDQLDKRADKTIDRLHEAQRDLIEAKSGARAREARETIEKQERILVHLNESRSALRAANKALERWIKHLKQLLDSSRPACNDSLDNDGDGAPDWPLDPGCVDLNDHDEKDEPLPLACPAPGASTGGVAVINAPSLYEYGILILKRLQSGEGVVNESIAGSTGGGPSPLPGAICGTGISVTYEYRVYTDGTPFGLPDSPPDHHSIGVFIDANNPMASGNPGGQDASLRLAVGTAPP
jgi:hypothetical protein